MHKPTLIAAIALLVLPIAACNTLKTSGCLSAPPERNGRVYVVSAQPNGDVCYKSLELNTPKTEFLSTGIMQEGPLPAPVAK